MTSPSLGVSLRTGTTQVQAVQQVGLAADAGVSAGDQVLSVRGQLVATGADIVAAMSGLSVGDAFDLQVARGGQVVALQTIVAPPPPLAVSMGVSLRPGTTQVMSVAPAGLAATAGVLAGDQLMSVNGRLLASGADVRAALDGCSEGEVVSLQVNRSGVVTPLQAIVHSSMLAERTAPARAAVTASSAALPPAGWYPSPAGDGTQRYWDGTQWSAATGPAQYGVARPQYAQTSGLAVASLICAFLVPFVLPIILGVAAKNDIRRSNGTKTGEGLATAGIVLGWIFTIITVLWVFVVFAALSS
ncbi:MAG: PDZ domain-containing protein [Actinobacteria bacterium]|uniref:Unannotated protein n=1 Tax=freshwater metagenome TaxID=449393 RepID=A0A6J7KKH9_9ZZZZ|nr:PDZ domain-containing protein [Actinomycetota bacterium]